MVAELVSREEAKARGEIEDEESSLPLEGFGARDARLANLEDLIAQLVHLTARVDMSRSDMASRPTYPHVAELARRRRDGLRAMELQLIPGGE